MIKDYLIYKLGDEVKTACRIDNELFKKHGVKRGLRNENGSGVLVGLTNIGNVVGYEKQEDGTLKPVEGKLFYRGYELKDLVTPVMNGRGFGYEEAAFLLLYTFFSYRRAKCWIVFLLHELYVVKSCTTDFARCRHQLIGEVNLPIIYYGNIIFCDLPYRSVLTVC